MNLPVSEVDTIARVIAEQAENAGDPGDYVRDLLRRADLPPDWRRRVIGRRTDDLELAARALVRWAESKGTNPIDRRYTTLGSLLVPLLRDVGPDVAAPVVAVIVLRGLYPGPDVHADLIVRFQVPVPDTATALPTEVSAEEVTLQRAAATTPRILDVGSLTTGIRRAGSICRVEVGDTPLGTGFLIAPGLVLTAGHVIAAGDELPVRLRFRCTTAAAGVVSAVRGKPVRPVPGLDLAVLRLAGPAAAEAIPLDLREAPLPRPGDSLAILQHPDGGPMGLAITANGVAQVDTARHRIRYATTTRGGSSGAPCFDEQWRVVALHRAERTTFFGAVREGVLTGALATQLNLGGSS